MSDNRTLKFWEIESDQTGSNLWNYSHSMHPFQHNPQFDVSEIRKKDQKIEELQEFINQILNQKELVEAERLELISENKKLRKQVQELVEERNALLLDHISLNEASAMFAKETMTLKNIQQRPDNRVIIHDDVPSDTYFRTSRREESKNSNFGLLNEQQFRDDREIARALQEQLQNNAMQPRRQVIDRNLRSSVRRNNQENAPSANSIDPDDMTYEQLLELGDKIGHVSKGLRVDKIHSFPTEIFSVKNSKRPADQRKCMVCHSEYEEGETLKRLQCTHDFHSECIGKWLTTKKTCPICFHEAK